MRKDKSAVSCRPIAPACVPAAARAGGEGGALRPSSAPSSGGEFCASLGMLAKFRRGEGPHLVQTRLNPGALLSVASGMLM